jgi:sodium-dependent phosphate transporter
MLIIHLSVGGIIGVGFATVGPAGVDWSWKGVSQVFAAWLIAPCLSAAFGAILFLITKYCVVKSKKPVIAGLLSVPIYFAITGGILTMLIVWKGAASLNLDNWGIVPTAGTIFGVAGGVAMLAALFIVPHTYVLLVKEDWTLKTWEVIKGPFLLRRAAPPPMPEGHHLVPDYYRGHRTLAEIEEHGVAVVAHRSDEESDRDAIHPSEKGVSSPPLASTTSKESSSTDVPVQGKWREPANILRNIKWFFFRGVMMDVVSAQSANQKPTFVARLLVGKNLEKKHALVTRYDNRVEHLYSLLQVMTAATASFAHGANDVSNAMGPFSAIFQIWQTNTTGARSEVPLWILAFGGGSIAIGLWTYGYKLMQNLGNRITLHSPIRGFCMELGAAITVVLATRLALPVSTTQCIIGATVGVGLCSGEIRAVNWRVVAWSYFAWFVTLPSTAVIAGLLMAFTINAPQWTRPE